MSTTTHFAGIVVRLGCNQDGVGGRIIQRCSVCGLKLCDNINSAQPLNPDGTMPDFPTWPVGELVRQTAGNPEEWTLLSSDDGRLPADACIDLVEP